MDQELSAHVKYWINDCKRDCFFNVGGESGPNERIGAIKVFLMGHSEPMRRMLEESDIAEKGEITLPDIEPKSFKSFLTCVYGGSDLVIKNLTFEECAKLLYIAEKYLVTQVKQNLLDKMVELMPYSIDEFFVALQNRVCFQVEVINEAITDVLKHNTDNLFADERFLDISSDALMIIVQQESLNVKELDIFEAIVKWAKHKISNENGKDIRQLISEHIPFIRFRLLSCEQFCEKVIPTGVLTPEEACEISNSIASKRHHTLIQFSNINNLRLVHQTSHKGMRLAYSFPVGNIYEEIYESGFTKINEHYWKLGVKKVDNYLALYLLCKPISNVTTWEYDVTAELVLVNQSGKGDYERPLSCKYNEKSDGWENPKFMFWADVFDPSNGFIKQGSIIVVAYITLS